MPSSAFFHLVSLGLSSYATWLAKTERDKRLAAQEKEKTVARFRDPLVHATYDLQSRIYNIYHPQEEKRFLQLYTTGAEKSYAVNNTVFLFAQFFGWTELVRQELQFVDLSNHQHTREFRTVTDGIYTTLQSSDYGTELRIFAGNQRAIGELMIDATAPHRRCIGYAAFLETEPDSLLYQLLQPLRDDIEEMATDPTPYRSRLSALHDALLKIMELLDSKRVRRPAGLKRIARQSAV